MSSGEWRPSFLGLNVLTTVMPYGIMDLLQRLE